MTDEPGQGIHAVHDITATLAIRVTGTMPPLSQALEREVEHLWQAARVRMAVGGAGRLFNGQAFNAARISPGEVAGHLTEYRRVVAQMERPALFESLQIRSLAVNGVLRCADGVAFGRRHRDAVYQPGLWQMPPAGSIDASGVDQDGRVDWCGQLLTELREEVGLDVNDVAVGEPICIVEHAGSHVLDLGVALRTALNKTQVLAAHRASGNTEYEPMRIVPEADLADFAADAGATLVPSALVFLRRLGLIPPHD